VSCSVPGLTLLFSDPSQAIRKQQKRIAPEQDPIPGAKQSVPTAGQKRKTATRACAREVPNVWGTFSSVAEGPNAGKIFPLMQLVRGGQPACAGSYMYVAE
jgi:hypothetical protein